MTALREVVIGANSRVWKDASRDPRVAARFTAAIGHREVPRFQFTGQDRVWLFSYSRIATENSQLLSVLEGAHVSEVVYVSSASTIATRLTSCYSYPRVKMLAEREARSRLDARVLTLGLVFEREDELPAGANAATNRRTLQEFLLDPRWPEEGGRRMTLIECVRRPFSGTSEAFLQRFYGALQWKVRRWPCVLRPLDFVLRACGFRWYGYVLLSNRLWCSTTSSSALG